MTTTLADPIWRPYGLARAVGLAVAGICALTVSAKTQIPGPVPMTLQSLVIMLIGLAYGSRLGTATVLGYLAAGLAGIPVFAAATAGPASFVGPTGGYLIGFALAAAAIGWLAEHGFDRTLSRAVAAMTVGHVLLFIPGVAWLAVLTGSVSHAIDVGLTPFLLATVVKTAIGAGIVAAFWPRLAARLS